MVFKTVSCCGVFTGVYLHTALPQCAAAKLDIACPCVPRTPGPCPNPRRPHSTCPFLTLLGVGCSSSFPGASSPMASDTAGTHLGEEGTCLSPAAGPGCSSGQGSHVVCSPELFCSRLKLPGTGNNNPGRRWQQAV